MHPAAHGIHRDGCSAAKRFQESSHPGVVLGVLDCGAMGVLTIFPVGCLAQAREKQHPGRAESSSPSLDRQGRSSPGDSRAEQSVADEFSKLRKDNSHLHLRTESLKTECLRFSRVSLCKGCNPCNAFQPLLSLCSLQVHTVVTLSGTLLHPDPTCACRSQELLHQERERREKAEAALQVCVCVCLRCVW